jgi:hypothetical protein
MRYTAECTGRRFSVSPALLSVVLKLDNQLSVFPTLNFVTVCLLKRKWCSESKVKVNLLN